MSITTIVPRLPPAIDGVGDYAWRLATQFSQNFGITTQFVVADPVWQGASTMTEISSQVIPVRSKQHLLQLIRPLSDAQQIILLHYVPHGYARKACPFWLVRALEQWKSESTHRSLITFFHELYALDWHRPWSSDFWLSPVQQHLAARLAQLSDVCLTSTERYTQDIDRLSQGKHAHVPILPIFSNVGEPTTVLPLTQRQRHLVIFGQRHSKRRIYQESGVELERICRSLAIEQVWDIGPQTGMAPESIAGIPVRELGELPATEISDLLSRSLAGFLTYDPWRLSKSGIFAAYCAHGLLPVNHRGLAQPVDGLIAGTHYYVSQPASTLDLDAGQAIANQAFNWYQSHCLSKQAQIFTNWFTPNIKLLTFNRGAWDG